MDDIAPTPEAMPPAPTHWGRWVRQRGELAGFRGRCELAAAVGCSRQHLSKYWRMKTPPKWLISGRQAGLVSALQTDARTLFVDYVKLTPDAAQIDGWRYHRPAKQGKRTAMAAAPIAPTPPENASPAEPLVAPAGSDGLDEPGTSAKALHAESSSRMAEVHRRLNAVGLSTDAQPAKRGASTAAAEAPADRDCESLLRQIDAAAAGLKRTELCRLRDALVKHIDTRKRPGRKPWTDDIDSAPEAAKSTPPRIPAHWGRWITARAKHVGVLRRSELAACVGCPLADLARWLGLPIPPRTMRAANADTLAATLKTTKEIIQQGYAHVAAELAPMVSPASYPPPKPPPDPPELKHEQWQPDAHPLQSEALSYGA